MCILVKVLIYMNKDSEWSLIKSLKTKEKHSWVIPKVVTVAYRDGHLRELLSHSSNRVSQRWSWLELVSYQSGRKESFNCIDLKNLT